jgi:hypothetical protein
MQLGSLSDKIKAIDKELQMIEQKKLRQAAETLVENRNLQRLKYNRNDE